MRGKIIKSIAGFYEVDMGGEVYRCRARGLFREQGIKPLVGDDVEMEVTDLVSDPKEGSVVEILPRRNAMVRPNVANVDLGIIFFAGRDPDPSLLTIDQLLILFRQQGIGALIAFNKADLMDREQREELLRTYAGAGVRTLCVSARTGEGIEALRAQLRGKTAVFTGPSGAGKSSFINALGACSKRETGEISRRIRRGRNTTRSVELVALGEDSFLVDTPGFTSLEVTELAPEELKGLYPEFLGIPSCRFLSCVHDREPDCAVKAAVRAGDIPRSRYANYIALLRRLREQAKIY